MNKFILVVIICIFTCIYACKYSKNITKYPSKTSPDQITLNITKTPQNSINISWRTSFRIKKCFVEYKNYIQQKKFFSKAKYLIINTKDYKKIKNDVKTHRFYTTIKKLLPDTIYEYRVCNEINECSRWYTFKTASNNLKKFSFIYLGDVQNGISLWAENFKKILKNEPNIQFTIIAGDLVNDGNNRAQYDDLMGPDQNMFSNSFLIPVIGNHETRNNGIELYKSQFVLPENGATLKEHDYWFKYNNTLFLVLDSNNKNFFLKQKKWMETIITNNPTKWIITIFHHPIWSATPGRNNKQLRDHWSPVFENLNVDLVLNGHDHSYMRTWPVIKGKHVEKGPIYIVSVSGKKMYLTRKYPFTAFAKKNTATWQKITINDQELNYEAKTFDNKLIDSFIINKN